MTSPGTWTRTKPANITTYLIKATSVQMDCSLIVKNTYTRARARARSRALSRARARALIGEWHLAWAAICMHWSVSMYRYRCDRPSALRRETAIPASSSDNEPTEKRIHRSDVGLLAREAKWAARICSDQETIQRHEQRNVRAPPLCMPESYIMNPSHCYNCSSHVLEI